jgi:hypothetical protein
MAREKWDITKKASSNKPSLPPRKKKKVKKSTKKNLTFVNKKTRDIPAHISTNMTLDIHLYTLQARQILKLNSTT